MPLLEKFPVQFCKVGLIAHPDVLLEVLPVQLPALFAPLHASVDEGEKVGHFLRIFRAVVVERECCVVGRGRVVQECVARRPEFAPLQEVLRIGERAAVDRHEREEQRRLQAPRPPPAAPAPLSA